MSVKVWVDPPGEIDRALVLDPAIEMTSKNIANQRSTYVTNFADFIYTHRSGFSSNFEFCDRHQFEYVGVSPVSSFSATCKSPEFLESQRQL